MFRLVYDYGWKSTLEVDGINLDIEHIKDEGCDFVHIFKDAQEAAVWMAKNIEELNKNMHYGYYYINVINWQKAGV